MSETSFDFGYNVKTLLEGLFLPFDDLQVLIGTQEVEMKNAHRECVLSIPYLDNGIDREELKLKFKRAMKYLQTGVVDDKATIANVDLDLP